MDIVEVVEEDQIMTLEEISDEQEVILDDSEIFPYRKTGRSNLDIIDDVNCTDGTYSPFDWGKGADIYIVDSGINYAHTDFRYTRIFKQGPIDNLVCTKYYVMYYITSMLTLNNATNLWEELLIFIHFNN